MAKCVGIAVPWITARGDFRAARTDARRVRPFVTAEVSANPSARLVVRGNRPERGGALHETRITSGAPASARPGIPIDDGQHRCAETGSAKGQQPEPHRPASLGVAAKVASATVGDHRR